jgi:hypothetical protein
MNALRLSAIGFCLLIAAACGKKDDAAAVTSTTGAQAAAAVPNSTCDSRAENGKCGEYTSSENAEANKMACGMFKGTWSTTPCPKDQAFASCTMDDKINYYFAGKSNSIQDVGSEFASIDCDMVSGKLATLKAAVAPAAAAPAVAPKPGKPHAKTK